MDNDNRSIFFYHMRKAGGTSLRRLLANHCLTVPRELEVIEGWSLNGENHEAFLKSYFSIICLRNPIDRIKSSYKYEGRWKQQAEIRDHQTAKPFKQWVSEVSALNPRSYLWECVENYYIKALIGYPKLGSKTIGETELKIAMEVLNSFNMVLICEKLSSDETSTLLKSELDVTLPISNIVFPTKAPSPKESDHEIFNPDTIKHLSEANELDFRLYEYAKLLFSDRVKALSK
jgi:hypothetical protein